MPRLRQAVQTTLDGRREPPVRSMTVRNKPIEGRHVVPVVDAIGGDRLSTPPPPQEKGADHNSPPPTDVSIVTVLLEADEPSYRSTCDSESQTIMVCAVCCCTPLLYGFPS
jgi:hypothetical protein